MADRTSDAAVLVDETDASLSMFARQAAARSADKQTALFEELGRTLDALLGHAALKDDAHFAALLTRLAGADDMTGFHDRALQIETYARSVALAHGVEPNAIGEANAARPDLMQMPDHMSDLEETELTRTRLNMR